MVLVIEAGGFRERFIIFFLSFRPQKYKIIYLKIEYMFLKKTYFCPVINKHIMEYTVILEKMDNGQWFCQCEQVPEAVTQGATIEEAKENIKDAIEMVLAAKKELTRKQFIGRRILRRKIAIL